MKDIEIPIVYEDENVVVFNKPAGLMVHPDGKSEEYTLADYVADKYPDSREVGEALVIDKDLPTEKVVHRPGIVHRLDRETSGLIIVAKKQNVFLFLKRQFKAHTVKKVYRAIVLGSVKNDTGIIDAPIGRSKSDFRVRTTVDLHTNDSRGTLREAITRYKVLNRFKTIWRERVEPLTYVEVYPLTGRTHQIRTHLRAIRHPIIGDLLYGPNKKREDVLFGIKRTMLHSFKISIEIPEKGDMSFEAAIPSDFEEILAKSS
jgi:23S rRNA pseudouridine1911/1915/1917 synthase